MGAWIATGAPPAASLQTTMQVAADRTDASTAIHQIFAYCVFGTQPIYRADQIFVARRRGEDVEAFHSGRRCGGLARAVGPAQGEGEGGRGGTLPSSPSKRPDWTASGSAAFCSAKELK